jgi:FKBP-type peptidyl-prolyl cis-trans isomerase
MRTLPIALASLALLGTAAAATLALQGVDNTRFPDLFGARQKQLVAAKVDLASAVANAETASGGKAYSATLADAGTGARWEIVAFAGDVEHKVSVDAVSGEVVSNTPTAAVALPGDAPSGDPQKSASGLVWYDLKVGGGEQPAGPSTKVKVHYTGWLLDGKKFDSSVDRGEPIDFPLNGVIKGWTEGVGSMKVGGKRKLVIPANLGYGSRATGTIPANGVLVFDVELIAIVK